MKEINILQKIKIAEADFIIEAIMVVKHKKPYEETSGEIKKEIPIRLRFNKVAQMLTVEDTICANTKDIFVIFKDGIPCIPLERITFFGSKQ